MKKKFAAILMVVAFAFVVTKGFGVDLLANTMHTSLAPKVTSEKLAYDKGPDPLSVVVKG